MATYNYLIYKMYIKKKKSITFFFFLRLCGRISDKSHHASIFLKFSLSQSSLVGQQHFATVLQVSFGFPGIIV